MSSPQQQPRRSRYHPASAASNEGHAARKIRAFRHLRPVARAHLLFQRREIHAEHLAAFNDDLSIRDDAADMRAAGAREEVIHGLHRHHGITIERGEVDLHAIRDLACREAGLIRRAIGETAVARGVQQVILAGNVAIIAPAAMQELPEADLPHHVVILVEGRAIEPDGDAATHLDRPTDGRDAGFEMQVRGGIGGDHRARLGDEREIVVIGPDRMREREAVR